MIQATAIIQARMSSTRFPAKVLRPIAGKPLLWHIIHRLKKSRYIKTIVIATSIEDSDTPLANYCKEEGIMCIRGPLDNVLERFRLAYLDYPNDYIVRITGDSPLMDADAIDAGLEALSDSDAEVSHSDRPDYIHEGFEVMRASFFERLILEKGDHPAAQEHVSGYLSIDPNFAQTIQFALPNTHILPHTRVSVDTPEDLQFIETLYQKTNAVVGDIEVVDIVRLIKAEPALREINQHVRQKMAVEKTLRVLICPEMRTGLGMGHVTRMLKLAQGLKTHHSIGVTFAVPQDQTDNFFEKGFHSLGLATPQHKGPELCTIQTEEKFDAIILDIRDETSLHDLEHLKAISSAPLIMIDDGSERKLAADMAFYPPVPQLDESDWAETEAQIFSGLEWMILPNAVAAPLPMTEHKKPVALITMGGSDPFGMTLPIAKLCNALGIVSHLIVPKGAVDKGQIEEKLATISDTLTIHHATDDMTAIAQLADFCICGYGLTPYEMASMGRPPLVFTYNEDDAISAGLIGSLGLGVVLGPAQPENLSALKNALELIDKTPDILTYYRQNAIRYNFAQGVDNIAEKIATSLA